MTLYDIGSNKRHMMSNDQMTYNDDEESVDTGTRTPIGAGKKFQVRLQA